MTETTDISKLTNGAWRIVGGDVYLAGGTVTLRACDEFVINISAVMLRMALDDTLDYIDTQYDNWLGWKLFNG